MYLSLCESRVFVGLFIDYCWYATDVGGGSVNGSGERHVLSAALLRGLYGSSGGNGSLDDYVCCRGNC